MNNSDTPIGDNGKKEYKQMNVKTVSNEEIKNNWEMFFEGYDIEFDSILVETTDNSRTIEGEEQEYNKNITSALNVLSSARYKFEMNRIIEGVKIAVRREQLDKIKRAKTRSIEKKLAKKEAEQKNPTSGTEKESR